MKNWMGIFCKIFDEDNYTAITAMTPIDYQTIVDIYPYRDSALEAVRTLLCYSCSLSSYN